MKLKNLFKKMAEFATSANFNNFSVNDQAFKMAVDDHHRAHNQAVAAHQMHVDTHLNTINTMHMMGPHF